MDPSRRWVRGRPGHDEPAVWATSGQEAGTEAALGSKYPRRRYVAKTMVTVPNTETPDTLYSCALALYIGIKILQMPWFLESRPWDSYVYVSMLVLYPEGARGLFGCFQPSWGASAAKALDPVAYRSSTSHQRLVLY